MSLAAAPLAKMEFRAIGHWNRWIVDMAKVYSGKVGPEEVMHYFLDPMEEELKKMKTKYVSNAFETMEARIAHKEAMEKLEARIAHERVQLPKALKADKPTGTVGIHAFSAYWKQQICILRDIQEDQGYIVPPKE